MIRLIFGLAFVVQNSFTDSTLAFDDAILSLCYDVKLGRMANVKGGEGIATELCMCV